MSHVARQLIATVTIPTTAVFVNTRGFHKLLPWGPWASPSLVAALLLNSTPVLACCSSVRTCKRSVVVCQVVY